MKTFECVFSARFIGAIGIWETFRSTVKAENAEMARLKLYDTYEHIQFFKCREIQESSLTD